MANYRTIIRRFPSAIDYLKGDWKWIRRGDVLAYAPQSRKPSFSTDDFGFRHTWFEARNLSVADGNAYSKIGFVLGASHLFGFGLTHNRETLASQLSEIVGYPVFAIAYPEADTRTLHSTLAALLRQLADQTKLIILMTGGDFTRYCYTRNADALFGSPLLPMPPNGQATLDEQSHFENLLKFTNFWTQRCADIASQFGIPFYLAHEETFFEKSTPDICERECELGTSRVEAVQRRFAAHQLYVQNLINEKARFAAERNINVVTFPKANDLLFVDEYHYRTDSQRLIAEVFAAQIG